MPSQLDRSIKFIQKQPGQKNRTEIKDAEALTQQADKTIKLLDHEFVTCGDKGEKENDMSLVSKAMAMKRKSTEKQIEFSNLEEALNVLKENVRSCYKVLELVTSYFKGLYSCR